MYLKCVVRLLLMLCLGVASVYGRTDGYEGDECSLGGENTENGTCTNYQQCQSAIKAYRDSGIKPTFCSGSHSYRDAILVCCVDIISNRGTRRRGSLTSRRNRYRPTSTTTTTEYVPKIPQYDDEEEEESCPDVSTVAHTASKNGRKAWDKCIEYQATFVYPCVKSPALGVGIIRSKNCHHATDTLVLGGEDAGADEFPHMVLLGFLVSRGQVEWKGAGTIISDRYVLTAAHITMDRDRREVRFIRAGALSRSSPYERRQMYQVATITKHPDYASPNKYNDIALLKTDEKMQLSSMMVPACLDMRTGVDYSQAIVTGWGYTRNGAGEADRLQKVTLDKFTTTQCKQYYPISSHLKRGYEDDSQMCYGDARLLISSHVRGTKDACKGDSGGPIQVKNNVLGCMYTVIGITSYGRTCGTAPGIYTRVSKYVPWIESVVWPADEL